MDKYETINKEFDIFVSQFDRENININRKIVHSKRVANLMLQLAQKLQLTEEQKKIAYLIGILHDIGRFEQQAKYHSYDDTITIDHGSYGAKLLKDGLLKKFYQGNYEDCIIQAVRNHNQLTINENVQGENLLFCKMIRDTDKADIYYLLATNEIAFQPLDVGDTIISEKVKKEFYQNKAISRYDIVSKYDTVVLRLAIVFDIYYTDTMLLILNNDYLNQYLEHVLGTDDEKKELMKMKEHVTKYIVNKVANKK